MTQLEELYLVHLDLMNRPLSCITQYGGSCRASRDARYVTCKICKEHIS
jgi:hypothetical protein